MQKFKISLIISTSSSGTNRTFTETPITNFSFDISFPDANKRKKFSNYDFTYDENFSIKSNGQRSLSFSMSKKIMKDYSWENNPFINAIKIGSIIKLEDHFNNHHFFTVTSIAFEPHPINMSFKYECIDSFSYQLTRQNDGYSIENNVESEDYLGARDLDFWANKIRKECYITDEYLGLDEELFLTENSSGVQSLSKTKNGKIKKKIKKSFSITNIDSTYQEMHLKIPFSVSGTTANAALISLGEQYGLVLNVAERFVDSEIKRYFWYEPSKNNEITGLKYSPEKNINKFNFNINGNALTTILNVESNTNTNDEIVSLIPAITPFFKQLFSSLKWSKAISDNSGIKYYPGMFSDIINGKQYIKTLDFEKATLEEGWLSIQILNTKNMYTFLKNLIVDPFYNKISFQQSNEIFSIVQTGDGINNYSSNKYMYEIVFEYCEKENPKLTYVYHWNENKNLDDDLKRKLQNEELELVSLYVCVKVPNSSTTEVSGTLSLSLTSSRDFTEEDVKFAEIADKCPWLENKIIDFSYFVKHKILTPAEYDSLMFLLQNNLRQINGQLLYWSSSYYNAVKNSAEQLSKILTQFDSLGAYFNSAIVAPISAGKTEKLEDTDRFNEVYNTLWSNPDKKTSLFGLKDKQVEYFNKYFLAEQRFLKAIYNFEKHFNAQYSGTSHTLYEFIFKPDEFYTDQNLTPPNENFTPGITFEIGSFKPYIYDGKNKPNVVYELSENGYVAREVIKNNPNVINKKFFIKEISSTPIQATGPFDSKKTYYKKEEDKEGTVTYTELSARDVAFKILQEYYDSFYVKNYDSQTKLSSIRGTDALKAFTPLIVPQLSADITADIEKLSIDDENNFKPGEVWPESWVNFWRIYKANLPLTQLQYAVSDGKETKTHFVTFIGQNMFNSSSAIDFSYQTFLEQVQSAKSTANFPYYRRINWPWLPDLTPGGVATVSNLVRAFALANNTDAGYFVDYSKKNKECATIKVLDSSDNGDILDGIKPIFFLNKNSAKEWNKKRSEYSIWSPELLQETAVTYSIGAGDSGAPAFTFKDSFFRVLKYGSELNVTSTYRKLYVDPRTDINDEKYTGAYLNTAWGNYIITNLTGILSAIEYYPLIAWSVPLTDYKTKETNSQENFFGPWESYNSNYYKDEDGEPFLILELMDYIENNIKETGGKILNSKNDKEITYPYRDLYYKNNHSTTTRNKNMRFNLFTCPFSLGEIENLYVSSEDKYVETTVVDENGKIKEDLLYYKKSSDGLSYEPVYTLKQAAQQGLFYREDSNKTKLISSFDWDQLKTTPQKISYYVYTNNAEYVRFETTIQYKEGTTDDNEIYTYFEGKFYTRSSLQNQITLFLKPEKRTEDFSNYTNGEFWYNNRDKIEHPSVFASAAAIEADLTTYWVDAVSASKLCKYFIPDKWQPMVEGSRNGFESELYYIQEKESSDDIECRSSIQLLNTYIPKISIIKDTKGSSLLPRYTFSRVYGKGALTLSDVLKTNFSLEQVCNYLFDGSVPDDWYATQEGTKTYYQVDFGGMLWSQLYSHLTGKPGQQYLGGSYDMLFKYFNKYFYDLSFPQYEELQEKKENLWRSLYTNYPSILLESKFSNKDATTSEELYKLASLYFKDISQPEKQYNIGLIDTSLLDGYSGQEIKLGDAIQLKVEDFYTDLDDIYELLSQFLFVTDIGYKLRENTFNVTVDSIKYQEKLLQSLVKLIR